MSGYLTAKDRLNITYWMICFTSFLQIAFIILLIYMTTHSILQAHQAASFIKIVNVIPIAYTKIPYYAIGSFIVLLLVMKARVVLKETTKNILIMLILEVSICMVLMYAILFTTNTILLFVVANMMAITRKRGNKGLSLIIMMILFLATNYDVISNIIDITSFQLYLSVYNAGARALFLGINNVLSTLCIICFILYILFLVQDQFNESKKIQNLNIELQYLNDQLKEYADVREKMGETKERNRLAREIHDTLGHTLTGLSMGLEACKALLDVNVELAKKQLNLLSNVAKDGLKDVRRSVRKLRPDALENHSLKEALESMIDDFVKTTGVKVYFICHLESLAFQKDEEDTIYRILQEGTTNAIRHGKATELYISFGKADQTLIIIIEDNGVGCTTIKDGFGLHHMKERVALLNGSVRCYGTDGFVLLVELPIREENQHD